MPSAQREGHGTAPPPHTSPTPRACAGAYLPQPAKAVLRRHPLGLRLAPAVQLHQEMVGVDGSLGRGAEEEQQEEEGAPQQRRPRRHGPALRARGGSPPRRGEGAGRAGEAGKRPKDGKGGEEKIN